MTSDMKDTELETRIENMLDFFTQPGEKYLKDLQNDLVDLIKRETDKARQEGYKKGYLDAGIAEIVSTEKARVAVEAQLKQQQTNGGK